MSSEGRKRWMFQLKQKEKIHWSSVFFFFYSGRPSMHQMMPAYTGEGDILYSVDSNVNPFKPNINDTLRSNVLPTM